MMKTTRLNLQGVLTLLSLLILGSTANAQVTAGTSVSMTLQNAVQTAPNEFTYDVYFVNTGTSILKLRGYSTGINHTPGLANGGTITHTFVSRDPSLATIPVITPGYTASSNHCRLTTINATPGNEVALTVGVPVRIATMRIATSAAAFPSNFNPFMPTAPLKTMQVLTAAGRTQCVASCIVDTGGAQGFNPFYAFYGTGNPLTATSWNVLTGVLNTPCFYLNPTTTFDASITGTTPVACFGASTGTAQVTISNTGLYDTTALTGFTNLNGGTNVNYSGNPFTTSNLSVGTNTIVLTTSYGCKDTLFPNVTGPTAPLTSSFSATACDSYALPWSTTVTVTGVYTSTLVASNTCDSIVTANITINNSSSSSASVTSTGPYTWAANSTTYTVSGIYTATVPNAALCDSVITLDLTVNAITTFITASVLSPITCNGSNNGVAQATISGGTGTYTYNIDGGAFTNTTGTFSGVTPGVHTICATDGALTFCDTVLFTDPSLVSLNASNTNINCNGGNSVISATATGGTGTITITVNGSPLAANYAAGTYTVTATDQNSCSSVSILNITQPSALSSSSAVTSCDSYTWASSTTTYSNSGTYTTTVLSSNGCDSVLTLNLVINASTINPSTTASACSTYTWAVNGVTYTTSGVKTATYLNTAGCDSSYTLNLTINTNTVTNSTITAANTYTWPVNGVVYTNSGTYIHTVISTTTGCLETSILNLTINTVAVTVDLLVDQEISCYGNNDGSIQAVPTGTGPFTFILDGGVAVNNTGFFGNLTPGTHTVCAIVGLAIACDTVSLAQPDSLAATFTIDSVVSCHGNDGMLTIDITGGTNLLQGYLTWWTNVLNPTDTLNDVLTDNFALSMDSLPVGTFSVVVEDDRGCFKTFYGNMVAAPPIVPNATFPPIVCFGGTTSLTPTATGGVPYAPLVLTVNGAPVAPSYGPGTYTITATDAKGCTGTTSVTITAPLAPITSNTSVTACNSYTWSGNNITYTSSGVYTATVLAANGCDSIPTINLTINNSSINTPISATACDSYTWGASGITYTGSGTYTASFTNMAGCDSSVTLNLTINSSTNNAPLSESACISYTWASNGVTYTSSGTYVATFLNAAGCDSSHTLNLTINNTSPNVPQSATACDTYTWSVNGTTYTGSGTYTATFLNAAGCDSNHTLNLTINNSSINNPTTASACLTYTWSVNSLTYTSSGTYVATFLNASGCDSSITLNLTINGNTVNTPASVTACDSYTWSANGVTYTASGTYTATFLNANGCDSSHTLNLIINPLPNVTAGTPTTLCFNGIVTLNGGGASTYTWNPTATNGVPFLITATTTYTVTGTDGNGCSATSSVSITVTSGSGDISNTTTGNATSVAGTQCQIQNQADGTTISYHDTLCKLIATVQDPVAGNLLGNVNACVIVLPTVPTYNGQPYFARYYTIAASSGPANLTLYLTQDDFNDYNANAGTYPQIPVPANPTNGATVTLCISQVPQTTLPGAPGGQTIVHTVTAVWNAAANRWDINFPVNGFGGFYFHACTGVPLPAVVTSFTGRKGNVTDILEWTTSSEQNNAYFNLEYSTDAINYTTLSKVNSQAIGGNSNVQLNYYAENLKPALGHNYYRLQQVDINGSTTYVPNVVDLLWGADGNNVTIYPNPATEVLHIDLYATKSNNTVVKLLDMSGRTVKQVISKSNVGMNNITISIAEIANGIYTMQLFENDKLTFVQKVKKDN